MQCDEDRGADDFKDRETNELDWWQPYQQHDVIDADGHVLEPPNLWLDYIEPAFREFAPRLGIAGDGAEVFQLRDQAVTANEILGCGSYVYIGEPRG